MNDTANISEVKCMLSSIFRRINYESCVFSSVHHFGRAVIMFGVPYVYTQSRILKVRTVTLSTPVSEITIFQKMNYVYPLLFSPEGLNCLRNVRTQ